MNGDVIWLYPIINTTARWSSEVQLHNHLRHNNGPNTRKPGATDDEDRSRASEQSRHIVE